MTTKQDSRRIRLTLSEDQASWIETNFGGADANKADVIKNIIDDAMSEKPKLSQIVDKDQDKSPAYGSTTVAICGMNGADKTLRTLQATLEMFIQKYMADHPERTYSNDFLATMEARWMSFIEYKRPEYMAKGGYVAP